MSASIFVIVLLAALLHAVWNAMVKGGADKTAAMAGVVVGQGCAGGLLLPFAQVPDPAALPYLVFGVALHLGYQLFLLNAYRIGDLTQVYPIARGVSPLLVAAVSLVFLGERLARIEIAAILMIAIGIASISLVRRDDGMFQLKAAMLALTTGGFIAGYSLVDGIGARVAGTALGFYGWLSLLNAIAFIAIARVMRPGLVGRALRLRGNLIIGGGASFTAYALVVYAFTQAPIALVTALRETSIVFALVIGVIFLNERVSLAKVISTAATLAGAALLRLSRS